LDGMMRSIARPGGRNDRARPQRIYSKPVCAPPPPCSRHVQIFVRKGSKAQRHRPAPRTRRSIPAAGTMSMKNMRRSTFISAAMPQGFFIGSRTGPPKPKAASGRHVFINESPTPSPRRATTTNPARKTGPCRSTQARFKPLRRVYGRQSCSSRGQNSSPRSEPEQCTVVENLRDGKGSGKITRSDECAKPRPVAIAPRQQSRGHRRVCKGQFVKCVMDPTPAFFVSTRPTTGRLVVEWR